MRKKSRLSIKFLSSTSWRKKYQINEEIEEVEKKLYESYSERRMKFEKEPLENIMNERALFYAYAKKFFKDDSTIANLRHNGKIYRQDVDKANILQHQYASM